MFSIVVDHFEKQFLEVRAVNLCVNDAAVEWCASGSKHIAIWLDQWIRTILDMVYDSCANVRDEVWVNETKFVLVVLESNVVDVAVAWTNMIGATNTVAFVTTPDIKSVVVEKIVHNHFSAFFSGLHKFIDFGSVSHDVVVK